MKFVSIGDCCVDTYPNKKNLGGMAYNSAIAASKYGVDVSVVSAIGNDTNGDLYKNSFSKNNIDFCHVQVLKSPTSIVNITLDENHSPIFGKWELGALEKWNLLQKDLDFISSHDVAKITCLKSLEKQFQFFYQTPMPNTIKAADFDGDSQYSFSPHELIKYIDRLDVVVKGLNKEDSDAISFLQQLAKEKRKIILITLGENGSMCFANDMTYTQEAIKINTTNTTGFGDAFLAIFLIKYFEAKDIQLALFEATKAIKGIS